LSTVLQFRDAKHLVEKNASRHSILNSPVPKMFFLKLHRIPFKFVLAQ